MATPGYPKTDALWLNGRLACMTPGVPYGRVDDGALAVADGKITWVGPRRDLPVEIEKSAHKVHDAGGRWITPGLVDCHTHLIYGGHRAHEFELRLQGATYEEIARRGGGIVSTVKATRAAGPDELFDQAALRLTALLREGVTTVEIKSGYGLDLETEIKMLRVARRLGDELPVTVKTTFLGAHALPPEYVGRSDEYVDFICHEAMPEAARQNLADAVDVFCENIAFSPEQTERVFQKAVELGLPVKLHAEQLSDQGGAALAARYKALSVDHLEHLSESGVKALAEAGVTAVLLPGAFYFIRETHLPPVELLRKAGVPMALASDHNPGTCPTGSLLLMLNMACTLFRLTPEEALAGVTRNGAKALGLDDRIGMLEPGRDADFVLWDITEPAELAYRFGHNPGAMVVKGGEIVIDQTGGIDRLGGLDKCGD